MASLIKTCDSSVAVVAEPAATSSRAWAYGEVPSLLHWMQIAVVPDLRLRNICCCSSKDYRLLTLACIRETSYDVNVTGGEIVAVGALAKAAQTAEEAVEGSPKDRDLVRDAMKGTHGLEVAANAKADRLAVRQMIINRLIKPLFWFSNYQSQYFSEQFETDLAEKLTEIPQDNIQAPAPIVAAQTMEGLAFSFDEPDLKELYLNLLRTAADDRSSQHAHPSFASIIKSLTPTEARLIKIILAHPEGTPAAEIRWKNEASEYITRRMHVLDLHDMDVNQRVSIPELEAYVSNWVRLGLVDVNYTSHRASPDAYDWVEQRPEFVEEQASAAGTTWETVFQKGLLTPTAFGKQFFLAVKPAEPENA